MREETLHVRVDGQLLAVLRPLLGVGLISSPDLPQEGPSGGVGELVDAVTEGLALGSLEQETLLHLVLAGYQPPLHFLPVLVQAPGGPVAGHSVVHRVVHQQDVVLLEAELERAGVPLGLDLSVEHGPDEVGVARAVLDLPVLVRVVLSQDDDLVHRLGKLVSRLLSSGRPQICPVVFQYLIPALQPNLPGRRLGVHRVDEDADLVPAHQSHPQLPGPPEDGL